MEIGADLILLQEEKRCYRGGLMGGVGSEFGRGRGGKAGTIVAGLERARGCLLSSVVCLLLLFSALGSSKNTTQDDRLGPVDYTSLYQNCGFLPFPPHYAVQRLSFFFSILNRGGKTACVVTEPRWIGGGQRRTRAAVRKTSSIQVNDQSWIAGPKAETGIQVLDIRTGSGEMIPVVHGYDQRRSGRVNKQIGNV